MTLAISTSDIISVLAIIISGISLILGIRFRTKLSFSEKIANVSGFVFTEYKNRKFITPIKIGKIQIDTIKDARNVIRENKKDNNSEEISGIEELEEAFSDEISRALQNIGMLTLIGALPIQLILPDLARIIVEDWSFCFKRIDNIHREKKLTLKKRQPLTDNPIDFSRRHAEWLANAAALYLQNYWEGEEVKTLVKSLGSIDTIKKREAELRLNEPDVSKTTSEEIRKFLYRSRI